MNILLIESATDMAIIAAAGNGKSSFRVIREKGTHSRDMFIHIDSVFSDTGISLKDVDFIAVGIGPGSFTGIRIAVTTARMLAQAADKPLVGVRSQRLYAESIKTHDGDVIAAAFDAKKGRVFGGIYHDENGSLKDVLGEGDYFPDEMLSYMKPGGTIYGIGDGCERYFSDLQMDNFKLIKSYTPDVLRIFTNLESVYNAHPEFYADYNKVVPFYSRKSDAEVLKDQLLK